MNAAAPGGAQSKNSEEFFSNRSSLMRCPIPRGGSMMLYIRLLAPPCLISYEIPQVEELL